LAQLAALGRPRPQVLLVLSQQQVALSLRQEARLLVVSQPVL
jgi:hypothetical protein